VIFESAQVSLTPPNCKHGLVLFIEIRVIKEKDASSATPAHRGQRGLTEGVTTFGRLGGCTSRQSRMALKIVCASSFLFIERNKRSSAESQAASSYKSINDSVVALNIAVMPR
jgi:hypothetical protein